MAWEETVEQVEMIERAERVEEEEMVEQEPETVWDCHTNDEWAFVEETQAEGVAGDDDQGTDSYDSGYGEPGAEDGSCSCVAEEYDAGETDSNDWGYGSNVEVKAEGGWNSCVAAEDADSNDSGCASNGEDEDPTKAHNEDRYRHLPFKTKHYFLTYVQRILEDTCLRYARQHLSTHLSDIEWKKRNVPTASSEYLPDMLAFKDWLAEDQMELESWMKLFGKIHLPPYSKKGRILESVIDLRNVAVHRGIYNDEVRELGFEELGLAMKLPDLLGDSAGASQIANAFDYVMEDPTMDENTKASVEFQMYTPQPCTSHYKLLGRAQTLLEETCFNYAARKIPHVLITKGWDMPEQVEFGRWRDVFWDNGIQHEESANDLFPKIDDGYLSSFLIGARNHIRNVVAHRSVISKEDTITQIHRAIDICILQGDWEQVVEIGVLTGMYFLKETRMQLLTRMATDFMEEKEVEKPYERERRMAVAEHLKRAEMEEMDETDALVVSKTCDEYAGF